MNPLAILLMLAMLATAGVLFVGLAGFFIGGAFNERYGNRLMRARVGLQLLAVHAAGPAVPHPALSSDIMVILSQIYTRGGDQGRTSLGDGTRVAKHTGPRRRLRHGGRGQRDDRAGAPAHDRTPPTRCWRGSRTTCSTSAPICAGPAAISRMPKALRIRETPGRAAGARDRRDERRAAAAELLRAARRQRRRQPTCISPAP